LQDCFLPLANGIFVEHSVNARSYMPGSIFVTAFIPLLVIALGRVAAASTNSVDFVKNVQPILANACYSCHGPEKQENDLRLDIRATAMKGGASGPVIIPGNSSGSKLIRMVTGIEKPTMPRKGDRLSEQQIATLKLWIDQGAIWPEEKEAESPKDKADWWSFKPAIKPSLPAQPASALARNEIDRFVLAKLQENKLTPSPQADRVTLIRRLTFDLHGLPPTPDEVQQFVSDKDTQSYEKLVDGLLASPRYGERWARHWLDTVHYGETHGYDKDKPRLNAWPYRDYVIRSFNADKPYSRFIQEQLAGDVLFPDEPDGIVALGFLASGPWDFVGHVELPIEKTDGLIARYNDRDDMVMTTMSTFQSLTVHCARCHNHKFDPISQKEYYSLQAVFAGIDRTDRPFDPDREVHLKRRTLNAKKMDLEQRFHALTNHISSLSSAELVTIDTRLQIVKTGLNKVDPAEKSPSNGYHSNIEKTPDVEKWVQVDLGEARVIQQVDLVPARPVDFKDTPGFGFPPRFIVEISNDAEFKQAEIIAELMGGDFEVPADKPFTIVVNSQKARYVRVTAKKLWERTNDYVFALAELQVFSGKTNVALNAEVTALDSIEVGLWSKKFLVDGFSSRGRLKNVLVSAEERNKEQKLKQQEKKLEEKRKKVLDALIGNETRTELTAITNRLSELKQELASLPAQQSVYAIGNDFAPNNKFLPAKIPRPVHLLTRGDVKRPAEEMKAAALDSVPGTSADFSITDPNNEGLRRAALAQWITDSKNMLTRRSIVNRIWHYHFGRGIVDTPNDFGHMGSQPTHPELLDWLAFWFLENGESLKKLHRLILTSATYRQSSENNAEAAKVDAGNRFLWRMNRSRLDAETIRDSMVFITGQIDFTMGGPSIQQFYFHDDHSPFYDYGKFDLESASANRRSIYRFVVRSVPDPFMDTLDCPDASLLSPTRNVSTTALQALAVLNDPFVLRQSQHFAGRLEKINDDVKEQISAAYQLAMNRAPRKDELEKLIQFTTHHGLPNTCRLIFNTSEFMFVD
jgi:mono/diheme cytochrome c family protein